MGSESPAEGPSEYPAGHLNHLSTEQAHALKEFKALCAESGCYVPASDNSSEASHNDETMLRFLRARRFVPQDAFRQFKDTEIWRKEQAIDDWYDTIDVEEYEETRRLYTHWTGRRDKKGIPLYVFKIAGLDSKRMSAYDHAAGNPEGPGKVAPKLRRLFATFEHLDNFVMPLCSAITSRKYPETPISLTNNIVDISGVGIRQFWNLREHLQVASTLATAHYPEMLGRIFIIGAPSFFPTVWTWIKGWFDPGTVAKIFILSQSDVKPTLEKFISASDIPKQYGGTLDWEFGQLPNLDPEILEYLSLEERSTSTIPIGPIRWRREGDKLVAHALGMMHGKRRDVVFAQLPGEAS